MFIFLMLVNIVNNQMVNCSDAARDVPTISDARSASTPPSGGRGAFLQGVGGLVGGHCRPQANATGGSAGAARHAPLLRPVCPRQEPSLPTKTR